MKKQQLDHVLRAAGRITGERQFIIIGSQSLHGKYPDLADEILRSAEVDLIAGNDSKRTEWLNAIGHLSPFHETFGYYADPVDASTATLPRGWKGRLVHLAPGETDGVRGLCLEPHDLAVAKYAAGRDKDLIFTRELARRALVSEERLLSLLDQTQLDESVRSRIREQITADFHAAAGRDPVRERAEWLKLRREAQAGTATPKPTRAGKRSKRIERDSGTGVDDAADD
ncbi:MAG TPA: DUF6036 family nucleotidyltransferase [Steroidobacteraceae bacterium]|nr:DUF6036 family nucleotidyltransferase [Steroidobacteraceae bacterium]